MPSYKIYESNYTGPCPSENAVQVTFFNRIRREYPDTYGKIATHIKNEGKRTRQQAAKDKADGMVKGASDIVIPAGVPFVFEVKKKCMKTAAPLTKDQQEYLEAAARLGAFAGIAYGIDALWEAWLDYLSCCT